MRKEFSVFQIAVCALSLLGFFGLRAYAQDGAHDQDADHKKDYPNGIVQDWSRRHVVYPRVGPMESLISLEHDPRAILSWQEAEREDWHREKDRIKNGDKDKDSDEDGDGDHGHSHGPKSGIQRDWSISLSTGTTAPAMYPAKFTFNINAAPTCIIGAGTPIPDFIVFPLNVAGSPSQPNIVAFQDLYSGTAGVTGICNTQRPSYFTGDTVASAATFWSYNITAGGGVVATSPALSLDGTRVAFVETGGAAAHFHVLAWNGGTATVAGDGVNTTDSQLVTSPKSITSGFALLAPVAGSGSVTDLLLGSANDTLSSPFVDYATDTAYVGNDSGVLFRVKNVFCTTPACTGGGSPTPTLDLTWPATGLSGTLTVCSGKLTGPVVAGNGNVFVGCSDGKLYGFNSTGTALSGSPVTVGDGTTFGGIVDPPLVDVVNEFVYVVSGSSGAGTGPSVLVQASATDLSSPKVATLGSGGLFNLHTPALNNAYFSAGFTTVANVQGTVNPPSTTSTPNATSNWQIYEWADSGVGGSPATLYGVGFNGSHAMTTGAAANFVQVTGSVNTEFSPVTELLNGSTDQIFAGALEPSFPNILVYNLTDFSPELFPNVFPPINGSNSSGATTGEGNGPSGVVVDNVSSSAQASSIYFGVQGSNTAVKLTQSGLN